MKVVCEIMPEIKVVPELYEYHATAVRAAGKILKVVEEFAPSHVAALEEFSCQIGLHCGWDSMSVTVGPSWVLTINVVGVRASVQTDFRYVGHSKRPATADEIALAFALREYRGDAPVPYERSMLNAAVQSALRNAKEMADEDEHLMRVIELDPVINAESA